MTTDRLPSPEEPVTTPAYGFGSITSDAQALDLTPRRPRSLPNRVRVTRVSTSSPCVEHRRGVRVPRPAASAAASRRSRDPTTVAVAASCATRSTWRRSSVAACTLGTGEHQEDDSGLFRVGRNAQEYPAIEQEIVETLHAGVMRARQLTIATTPFRDNHSAVLAVSAGLGLAPGAISARSGDLRSRPGRAGHRSMVSHPARAAGRGAVLGTSGGRRRARCAARLCYSRGA